MNKILNNQLVHCALLTVSLFCGNTQALADSASDSAAAVDVAPTVPEGPSVQSPSPKETNELAEVVVVATRRTTNLQETPLAVSALDSAQIQGADPHDLGDLAKFVPNFSAATITGFNAASFAMRGIGQTSIVVYYESPVSVLVDDFVVTSVQTQLLDTFDLDSIEVLRGPQGTLFGKNTTGGAVTIQTKRPDLNNFSGEGRLEYGSFDTRRPAGALNIPLIDGRLAARLVVSYDQSDGYMRDGACYGPVTTFVPTPWSGVSGCGDGERIGGEEVTAGRAKLLWEPSDDWKVLFQYELLRDKSEATPIVMTTPPGSDYLFNELGLYGSTGDPINNAGLSNRNVRWLNMRDDLHVNVDGFYLNADWKTAGGTLTNVIGYREQDSQVPTSGVADVPVAANGAQLSGFDADRADDRNTFQEELRYASSFTGPFNFVAGAFYQHENITFCAAQLVGFLDAVGTPAPFGPYNDTPYFLCSDQRGDSTAGYAEGTYALTEKMTLTLGGRYTDEEKRWRGRQQVFAQQLGGGTNPNFTYLDLANILSPANFNEFPAGVVQINKSWADPTYRAGLDYRFTDQIFSYFMFSHGFKSGGFNDQIGSFAPFGNNLAAFKEAAEPTNPEKANSFELGLKTQAFDNRLRVNVTGFYVKYSDLQETILRPIVANGQPFQVTTFFNVADATVKGLEAEIVGLPLDRLSVSLVLGLQDPKYDSYNVPLAAGYNLADAPVARAPKAQSTLDGTYRLPLGSKRVLAFNADASYTGRNLYSQSLISEAQNTFLEPHTLVNASVTLSDVSDRYYLRALGQNLTNKRYNTGSLNVAGLWTYSTYGPPLYWGLEAGVKFGAGQ